MNKAAENRYVTEKVFNHAIAKLATKDDLKRFVTKDDLKRFATKDDLKSFSTKDDLRGFTTKNEFAMLATAVQKLGQEVQYMHATMATKDELRALAEKMASKDDIRLVITTIDGFVKRLETQENRARTNIQRWKDLEPVVANHEKRILALESK